MGQGYLKKVKACLEAQGSVVSGPGLTPCCHCWQDTSLALGHLLTLWLEKILCSQCSLAKPRDLHSAWPVEGLGFINGLGWLPHRLPCGQSVLCQYARQQVVSFLTSTLN